MPEATAIHAEPFDRRRYDEIAERAITLGELAHRVLTAESADSRHEAFASLSPREQAVAELLLRGDPIGKIAQQLHLSVHTVRNHRKAIYRKVGVQSRVEFVAKLRPVAQLDF